MANNNIRLDIEVRNKGLLEAIKSTNTLEKNIKTLSDTYGRGASSYQRYYRAVRKLSEANGKSTKELLNHGKALRAEAAALSKAKKEAKEYARARREAEDANRAFDQQVKSYENLRRSVDANYASTQRFKEAQRVLRAELATGRISIQQYNDQLRLARKAMETTTTAAGQMGRRMSRSGVMVQQSGYQVGDFLVQIQSGTNPMVAFGQQATQMAGTLTLLGGKFILIGTVLGVVIPLVTALGAVFMRTRKEAKETGKEIKTFSDAVSNAQSAIDRTKAAMRGLGIDALRERYGLLTSDVRELAAALASVEKQSRTAAVETAMEKLFTPDFEKQFNQVLGDVGAAIVESTAEDIAALQREIDALEVQEGLGTLPPELVPELKILRDEMAAMTGDLENAGSLLGELEVPAASLDTFTQLRESIKQAVAEENFREAADGISGMRSLLESMGVAVDEGAVANLSKLEDLIRQSIVSLRGVPVTVEGINAAFESLYDSVDESVQPLVEYNERVKSITTSMQQQTELQEAINRHGADSLQVARLRAEQEAANQRLVGLAAKSYVEQALALHRVVQEGKKASDTLAEMQKGFNDLTSQSTNLDVEIAKVTAQIDAVKTGADVATAAYIAGEKAKATATYETTRSLALQTGNLILLAETAIAYAETMGKLEALEGLKGQLADIKPGGGGKKQSPAEKLREYLDGLKDQAALESALVGFVGKKREAEEAVIKARQEYGKVFGESQESELRGTLAQIEADKERQRVFEESEQQRQQLADLLESSMSDGFMAMVEGTKSVKDAFKDMARAIIKELYDVLVVQRLVGSYESGGGGILGGVFSLFGKASGGTVMSNQPYLVGEKGPELIVPRNRGHVMNADLTSNAMGGGGDVHVTNHFQFAANGDDSVKRIIAQAMPAIVSASKQGVMDARRRGGSMKNAFG